MLTDWARIDFSVVCSSVSRMKLNEKLPLGNSQSCQYPMSKVKWNNPFPSMSIHWHFSHLSVHSKFYWGWNYVHCLFWFLLNILLISIRLKNVDQFGLPFGHDDYGRIMSFFKKIRVGHFGLADLKWNGFFVQLKLKGYWFPPHVNDERLPSLSFLWLSLNAHLNSYGKNKRMKLESSSTNCWCLLW